MSKKLENAHKSDMVAAIRKAGGYARRIEDQYGVGILDLILCMPSTGIVIAEAKIFDGHVFQPRGRQYLEMCDWDNAGGVALLIGVKDGKYYLHGTNRDDHPRGQVRDEDCLVGDDFVEVFQRWYKEVIGNAKR
jgi:hypothetical protein